MRVKPIIWMGHPAVLVCDGRCNKAWGIDTRPRVHLSDDIDDYAFLADHELGDAPADPGTYEFDCAKPRHPVNYLNKWCCRECERSLTVTDTEFTQDIELPDFSERRYNINR